MGLSTTVLRFRATWVLLGFLSGYGYLPVWYEGVRPFVGLGAGAYAITSTGTLVVFDGQSPQDVTLLGETKFGGLVRAGIKTGHFTATVDYNADPATTNQLANNIFVESKNAYLALNWAGYWRWPS